MLHLHQLLQITSLLYFSIGLFHVLNSSLPQICHIRRHRVQPRVCAWIMLSLYLYKYTCLKYCHSWFKICQHQVCSTSAHHPSGDYISLLLNSNVAIQQITRRWQLLYCFHWLLTHCEHPIISTAMLILLFRRKMG